jgi:hypothetical protein
MVILANVLIERFSLLIINSMHEGWLYEQRPLERTRQKRADAHSLTVSEHKAAEGQKNGLAYRGPTGKKPVTLSILRGRPGGLR